MVGMDAKDQIIGQLRQIIEELRREIQELKLKLAKAMKDSSNSSKPPSKSEVKKKVRGKQKRKKGGQPGHKRQRREMLPPERVDEAFEYDMDEEEVRRRGLTATNEFEVVQKIELRQSPIHVTEHRLHVYLTPEGKRTTASVPEAKGPIFGPRMLATVAWMKSVAHCSCHAPGTVRLQAARAATVARGGLDQSTRHHR